MAEHWGWRLTNRMFDGIASYLDVVNRRMPWAFGFAVIGIGIVAMTPAWAFVMADPDPTMRTFLIRAMAGFWGATLLDGLLDHGIRRIVREGSGRLVRDRVRGCRFGARLAGTWGSELLAVRLRGLASVERKRAVAIGCAE